MEKKTTTNLFQKTIENKKIRLIMKCNKNKMRRKEVQSDYFPVKLCYRFIFVRKKKPTK